MLESLCGRRGTAAAWSLRESQQGPSGWQDGWCSPPRGVCPPPLGGQLLVELGSMQCSWWCSSSPGSPCAFLRAGCVLCVSLTE